MNTINRRFSHFYTNGKINDEGFSTLEDMHEKLVECGWDKAAAIYNVEYDRSCTTEHATDLIEWALHKLTA
jgi:hypothetical protein